MQLGEQATASIVSERSNRRGGDCRARHGIASADRHIVCTGFHPRSSLACCQSRNAARNPHCPCFPARMRERSCRVGSTPVKAVGIAAVGVTGVHHFQNSDAAIAKLRF